MTFILIVTYIHAEQIYHVNIMNKRCNVVIVVIVLDNGYATHKLAPFISISKEHNVHVQEDTLTVSVHVLHKQEQFNNHTHTHTHLHDNDTCPTAINSPIIELPPRIQIT